MVSCLIKRLSGIPCAPETEATERANLLGTLYARIKEQFQEEINAMVNRCDKMYQATSDPIARQQATARAKANTNKIWSSAIQRGQDYMAAEMATKLVFQKSSDPRAFAKAMLCDNKRDMAALVKRRELEARLSPYNQDIIRQTEEAMKADNSPENVARIAEKMYGFMLKKAKE